MALPTKDHVLLGRESQRLRKPSAVMSHVDVPCPGNLQISEVLVIMLRMCSFKLFLWNMVELVAQTKLSAQGIPRDTVKSNFKKPEIS